jgi:phytoene synthase
MAGAELDVEQRLALAYVPASRRPVLETLWLLDAALGAVLAGGREPMISRVKLAWWRESLERLDTGGAPAEPLLKQIEARLLPTGISGTALAELEEPWLALLEAEPLASEQLGSYAVRGRLLFRLSAAILGGSPTDEVERGGELWALVDLSRHCADPNEASAALVAARERLAESRWPRALRPLGMLAMLARRDAVRASPEALGSPSRALRMVWHRLSGR